MSHFYHLRLVFSPLVTKNCLDFFLSSPIINYAYTKYLDCIKYFHKYCLISSPFVSDEEVEAQKSNVSKATYSVISKACIKNPWLLTPNPSFFLLHRAAFAWPGLSLIAVGWNLKGCRDRDIDWRNSEISDRHIPGCYTNQRHQVKIIYQREWTKRLHHAAGNTIPALLHPYFI